MTEVSQGRAALSSLAGQRQDQRLAQDKLTLSVAPLVARLTGTLWFRRKLNIQALKGAWSALEGAHTGSLSWGFYQSSPCENLVGGFQYNKAFRCVFLKLMPQNELMGEFGVILRSVLLFYVYFGSVWL